MPINFTCPNCGKSTVVADQFAGQTGPCSNCGAKVTIPGGYTQSFGPAPKAASSGGGSTFMTVLLVILGVMLVSGLACAGIAYALLVPAIGNARAAAQRMQSSNNLKQLSLALLNYHDTYNTYPPAVVTDATGKPLYSGRVLLLPFIEQNALYQQFDKTKAWDHPDNQAVTSVAMKVFQDPASTSKVATRSDYVFVTGKGTIFDGTQALSMRAVTDGTSNTLVMVETSAGPSNWAEPKDWNTDTGTTLPGNRNNVTIVAFADGSVKSIPTQSFQQFMKQLAERSDGTPIPEF